MRAKRSVPSTKAGHWAATGRAPCSPSIRTSKWRRERAALGAEGIETAEYVPCIHLQPYMRERYGFGEGMCPVAEDTASRTVALPFFTQIEPADQERVVEVLRGAI